MFSKPVFAACAACILVFFSCGVEEYYFLPQVQENRISSSITNAIINIPAIPEDPYYYAVYYAIFYRIYTSENSILSLSPTTSDFSLINSNLLSDFNFLLPISNPANTSSTISANTFKSRNYFELEFEGTSASGMLPKTGGTLIINFPTATGDFPAASLDSAASKLLLRSSELISPRPDKYFRNSYDLRNVSNLTNNINADVIGSGETSYSYAAMYIVAVGIHPTNFSRIYSKPTFISVFRLPDLF